VPTTLLDLKNIQGNSIGGFLKDFQANLFLTFKDSASGRAWIKDSTLSAHRTAITIKRSDADQDDVRCAVGIE
jgi:hypothetical protein